MKRISLLAIAGSVWAQVPAPQPIQPQPLPQPQPVAPYVVQPTAPANPAPLAPIHDVLVEGNPAIERSMAALLVTPHDFFGQRAAAFQWNGGTSAFQGTALAVADRVFAAFDYSAPVGNLTGGYTARQWGIGGRLALNREGVSTSDSLSATNIKTVDSSLVPTGIGIFGSIELQQKLEAYAHIDWYTPTNYGSVEGDIYTGANKTSFSSASRSDAIKLGAGVRTEAKGNRGYSWNVSLDFAQYNFRNTTQSSDSTYPLYTIHQLGQLGKTIQVDGFVLGMGVDERIDYANGLGGSTDTSLTLGGTANHRYYVGPDWGYAVSLEPTLSIIVPIFENWTLKGGARTGIGYRSADPVEGEKALDYTQLATEVPTGSLGVRYDRGSRWAAEAQVSNAFLSNGPYFISGTGTTGIMTSFALTVNLK